MLVRLTLIPKGLEIYLSVDIIKMIERNQNNPLETVVTTNYMTPKGPIQFVVKETPDEAARLVNAALRDAEGKPSILTH